MRYPLFFAFYSIASTGALSIANTGETFCKDQVTVSESFIGKDRNVKLEIATCPGANVQPRAAVEMRQTNLCALSCNTNCFRPSGGGPDPNECHVIADALRYESQNTGAIFAVGTGTNNTIVMTKTSPLWHTAGQIGPLPSIVSRSIVKQHKMHMEVIVWPLISVISSRFSTLDMKV